MRHRKSKFDPYITEIVQYVVTGMSVREIAELIEYHFDDAVNVNALYRYMRAKGIKSMVTQGGTNLEYDVPKCDGCTECQTILNTHENKLNLCMLSKRIVSKSCFTSPMWCEKRKKAERQVG
jgi:hypothetical protein